MRQIFRAHLCAAQTSLIQLAARLVQSAQYDRPMGIRQLALHRVVERRASPFVTDDVNRMEPAHWGQRMAALEYDLATTGLLVVDPYNDFISIGGKFWDRLKTIAEVNHCVPNMLRTLQAARQAKIRVFYALHHRYRPGDFSGWKTIAPIQERSARSRAFEEGSWGGQVREEFTPLPGDVVALEHWCSSGFYNTDLDLQLQRHGIERLIVIGNKANTCIEATVRSAVELGYGVTLVKDAVASYSPEEMQATLEVNIPNYASDLVTTDAVIAAISKSQLPAASFRPLQQQGV